MGTDPIPTPASANLEELINLEMLPNWAREPARTPREFEDHGGEPPRRERPGGRGPRPPRREGFGQGGPRREEPRGFPRGDRRDRPPRGGERPGRGGQDRFPRREVPPAVPPPGLDIAILPEHRAVEAVAAQVKASGRAYPLFALARMFLAKPERFRIRFRATGKDGGPSTLLQCAACGAVARTPGELARHAIERHLADHYREEKVTEEPPKGNFAAIARCSLNGALLGPTNHHSFQAALLKLHRSRFPSMSLDRFKASIVLVRDPAAVEQWRQQVSTRTTWVPLHGEAPKALATEAELDRHFREHRFAEAVRTRAEFTVEGAAGRDCADPVLRDAVRALLAEESLFPRRLLGILADALTKAGLAIFRGPRGMLFVATTRPTPFAADPSHVAPGVLAILEYVRAHPRTGRKDLLLALHPSATIPVPAPAPEGTPAPAPDPQLVAFLGHLDWLVRQGHLIEYFNGELELVAPRPAGAAGAPAQSRPRTQAPRHKRRRGPPQGSPAPRGKAEKASDPGPSVPEAPFPAEATPPLAETPSPEPPISPVEAPPSPST